MIIKQAGAILKASAIKEDIHFAWFPKQLQRNINDNCGEIIWLEKYVKTYKALCRYPTTKPNEFEWDFVNSKRLSCNVLDKLEQ